MKNLHTLLIVVLILSLSACSGSKNTPAPIPPVNVIADATVTGISASSGVTGSTLIITGTNFGTDAKAVMVSFESPSGPSILATVLSVTNTQITVIVPVSRRGNIFLVIRGQVEIKGPVFFNTSPYAGGSLYFANQQDVDDFVANNKDAKAIQINGDLKIIGTDITSVSGLANITSISQQLIISAPALSSIDFLNNLTSIDFLSIGNTAITTLLVDNIKTGAVSLGNLPLLTRASFNGLNTLTNDFVIADCALLTDLNMANVQTTLYNIVIRNVNLTSLTIDKLTNIGHRFALYNIPNLKSVSAKSLTAVNWDITLKDCPALGTLNFDALATVKGQLILNNLPIKDLSAFKNLQTLGALTITDNANFNSFTGIEKITALTGSFSTDVQFPLPTNDVNNEPGLVIINNPALTSLATLQNLKTFAQVNISNNANLNDLCPLKAPLLAVNANPIVNSYPGGGSNPAVPVYLIILKNNGTLLTQQNALDALAACK